METSGNYEVQCAILHSPLVFWTNLFTAIAYISITMIMISLMKSSPLVTSLYGVEGASPQKRRISIIALGLSSLFGLFIFLCGLTHLSTAFLYLGFSIQLFTYLHHLFMTLCGVISVATALVMLRIYGDIRNILKNLEVTDSGTVTYLENYIIRIIDMIQESVVVLSSGFHIIRGNSSTEFFFGEGFIDCNVLNHVHPDDFSKLRDTMMGMENDGGSVVVQYRLQDKVQKNDYCWVESTFSRSTAMQLLREQELCMITRDIDERKRGQLLEAQLAASRALQDLNVAKLHYISCTVQDLKTPLHKFSSAIEQLRETFLSEDQEEYLIDAEVYVDLMRLTIHQTMDVSRSLSGMTLQPRRNEVNLTDLLERVQRIIDRYGSQVPIFFNVYPDISNLIVSDEEWLLQIFLNYLTNSCKYTKVGWIKMNISLTNSNRLLIEVIDTGIGIKPNNQKTGVFSMFGQHQKGDNTGTGLGLYGTKIHIHALGGDCGAQRNTSYDDTESNCGSTFWCKLPYVPCCLNSERALAPAPIFPQLAWKDRCKHSI